MGTPTLAENFRCGVQFKQEELRAMQILIALSASGVLTNIALGLAMYRKLTIVTYQHGLMWEDYAERKGLPSKKVSGAD